MQVFQSMCALHTRFERGANLKKNEHENQALSLKVLPMGSSKSAI